MTVTINRGREPQFKSFIERAKYKKALEREARDAEHDRTHPQRRANPVEEQRGFIKYFFDHYVGPGEFK
jgi:hypothetical protein